MGPRHCRVVVVVVLAGGCQRTALPDTSTSTSAAAAPADSGPGIGLGAIGMLGHNGARSPPGVGLSGISVEGGLAEAVARRMLYAQRGRLTPCHQACPTCSGALSVYLLVDKAGGVTRVDRHHAEEMPRGTERCLLDALATVTFPEPEGGRARVFVRVVLRPAHGDEGGTPPTAGSGAHLASGSASAPSPAGVAPRTETPTPAVRAGTAPGQP